MPRFRMNFNAALLFAMAWFCSTPAAAQITEIIDNLAVIAKGEGDQVVNRKRPRLGPIGGDRSLLEGSPGAREQRLQSDSSPGGGGTPPQPAHRGVFSTAHREARGGHQSAAQPSNSAPRQPAAEFESLDLPPSGVADDEGPPNGLTLEQAIQRLVAANHELRNKYFEIPQARADVLTAGLLNNPLVFGDASQVPYGTYTPSRQGYVSYSGVLAYPFDVSRKRAGRTDVATQELRVIEAQYQDAVRLAIDSLHGTYLDALVARENLRYTVASRDGLKDVTRLGETEFRGKTISESDLEHIEIQADSAELAVDQATVALRQSNRALGLLLDFPVKDAERLELRAALRDTAPPPPSRDVLVDLAMRNRPDLEAYRRGLKRAQFDVKLANAEKMSDVYLLCTPWQYNDYAGTGSQSSSSWSMAFLASVPLFDRNQGNIRRAELNVRQTASEVSTVVHKIEVEVDTAYDEYQSSRDAVERIERTILLRSTRFRDALLRRMRQGEATAIDYVNAQREHNDVVRRYRDMLIRHRRAMLRLNTVVGIRVLP